MNHEADQAPPVPQRTPYPMTWVQLPGCYVNGVVNLRPDGRFTNTQATIEAYRRT